MFINAKVSLKGGHGQQEICLRLCVAKLMTISIL
jgi:hypothetical protein